MTWIQSSNWHFVKEVRLLLVISTCADVFNMIKTRNGTRQRFSFTILEMNLYKVVNHALCHFFGDTEGT